MKALVNVKVKVKARVQRLLPGILFTALVLVAYADPLLTRRTFVGRDIVPYNIPLENVVHDAWSRGRLPVWWDAVSGGRPLLPNPNAGVFYPLRPVLAALPFPTAMRIFPVFHWVLGGLGMLLLARAIGGSRGAAWVSAVSFAFSGVIVSEVFYSNFQPGASLLPWTLWALVRPETRPARRVMAIALVYTALLLAGDVFSLTLAVLGGALWIFLETPPPERGRRSIDLGLGLLAAFLLALPQVLATALLAPETRRIIGGLSLGGALDFSTPIWRLSEFFVPFPTGETWSTDAAWDWGTRVVRHFFSTLFVGPIALAGLLRGKRNPPTGWKFSRTLLAVAVVFAVAGRFVPDAWKSLPSPIPLRYPEKFMVGATFALALAAGMAFDRWRQFRTGGRGLLAVAGVLALLAVAAVLAPEAAGRLAVSVTRGAPELVPLAARALPPALAIGGLLWAATAIAADLAAGRGRAAETVPLVLLTAIPLLANRWVAQTAHEGTVYPPTAFARTIAHRDPSGGFRALDETLYRPVSPLLAESMRADPAGSEVYRQSWYYFTQTIWKRGTVLNVDLDAGDLSRVESLRRLAVVAASQTDSGPFFSTLSMRFAIRFRDQQPIAGFRRFGGDAFRSWDENPGALPDIRLASSWRESLGPGRRSPHAARTARRGDRRRDRSAARRARAAGEAAHPRKKSGASSPRDGGPGSDLALRPPRRLELSDRRDRRSSRRDVPRAARIHRRPGARGRPPDRMAREGAGARDLAVRSARRAAASSASPRDGAAPAGRVIAPVPAGASGSARRPAGVGFATPCSSRPWSVCCTPIRCWSAGTSAAGT